MLSFRLFKNDELFATFALRQSAEVFLDILCGDARLGDEFRLEDENGTVLDGFDKGGKQLTL
jgi:hypothetical protein